MRHIHKIIVSATNLCVCYVICMFVFKEILEAVGIHSSCIIQVWLCLAKIIRYDFTQKEIEMSLFFFLSDKQYIANVSYIVISRHTALKPFGTDVKYNFVVWNIIIFCLSGIFCHFSYFNIITSVLETKIC